MLTYVTCQLSTLLALSLATAVAADLTVKRSISSLTGASVFLGVQTGCTGKDAYGSNDCDFKWGSTISLKYNLSLTTAIPSGTIDFDLKLKTGVLPLPLKGSCPLCGANW